MNVSDQRTTLQNSTIIRTTGAQVLISKHLGWPLA